MKKNYLTGKNFFKKISQREYLSGKMIYADAYFTVEAALLIPLIMLFVTIMIFLAFYSYDRCIMEHSAYEAALSGTGAYLTDTEKAAHRARSSAQKLIEGKLFAIENVKCEAQADMEEVRVTYYGELSMPFLYFVSKISDKADFSISVSARADRCCRARIIRNYKFLGF